MKEFYENRTRYYLPRKTYTIIRLDGKAFHTWTKGLERPYDQAFSEVMDATTKELCQKIQGAILGYVQSDEISIVAVDFGDKQNTDAWFDGNIQKICSVSASMCTSIFNDKVAKYRYAADCSINNKPSANFDSRVFTISDPVEVYNYFVWRQQDATRNSISSGARAFYSDKECFGKSSSDLQEMMFQAGQNWNDYPARFKRGGLIFYDHQQVEGNAINKKTDEPVVFMRPIGWTIADEAPIFTSQEGKIFINNLIPKKESEL